MIEFIFFVSQIWFNAVFGVLGAYIILTVHRNKNLFCRLGRLFGGGEEASAGNLHSISSLLFGGGDASEERGTGLFSGAGSMFSGGRLPTVDEEPPLQQTEGETNAAESPAIDPELLNRLVTSGLQNPNLLSGAMQSLFGGKRSLPRRRVVKSPK